MIVPRQSHEVSWYCPDSTSHEVSWYCPDRQSHEVSWYCPDSHTKSYGIAGSCLGSVGHAVFDRYTLLVGASGGVYALLGAHLAIVIMVKASSAYCSDELVQYTSVKIKAKRQYIT